jgi:hypothetical protein
MILKGGILVAAMVGLDNRSTIDVDTSLKNLPLNEESAKKIVKEIADIHIRDGMSFEIKSVAPIMDEADYPGRTKYICSCIQFGNGAGGED